MTFENYIEGNLKLYQSYARDTSESPEYRLKYEIISKNLCYLFGEWDRIEHNRKVAEKQFMIES